MEQGFLDLREGRCRGFLDLIDGWCRGFLDLREDGVGGSLITIHSDKTYEFHISQKTDLRFHTEKYRLLFKLLSFAI